MRRRGAVLLGILLLGRPSVSLADRTPIVAVFKIENKGTALRPPVLERLTIYLASKLSESGAYEVVPQDQLKRALTAKKKESYRRCFQQSCQIEIGQELAADKALATQVMKVGTKCVVTTNLYDLKKATSGKAATAKGRCDEDGISASIDHVTSKLGARTRGPSVSPPVPPTAPGRPGASSGGRLQITGARTGQKVTVTGAREKAPGGGDYTCFVPCDLAEMKSGSYRIELRVAGYVPIRRWVWVDAGKAVRVTLTDQLKPVVTNGSWSGMTEQGKKLTFVVAGKKLVAFHFEWAVPQCGASGKTGTDSLSKPAAVSGDTFSLRNDGPSFSFILSGLFSAVPTASGDIKGTYKGTYKSSPCSASFSSRWTATRH